MKGTGIEEGTKGEKKKKPSDVFFSYLDG